jgi:HK97 gp10 family phage protein
MKIDNRPVGRAALRELVTADQVVDQMRRTAQDIQRDARRLAPRRTGLLRRNIQIEQVFDETTQTPVFLVGWGPKAWYGRLVEFGTEHSTARPHLVPAAIKHGALPGGDR